MDGKHERKGNKIKLWDEVDQRARQAFKIMYRHRL